MATITFLKARAKDASTLAEVSKRAFHSDIHYGAAQMGGPPGYDSGPWQARMMRIGDYYKIVRADCIIGGILVHRKGVREYELGRIFIEPEFQNQGIGAQAFEFLRREYPLAKRWTTETPVWNSRNRHFYSKVGFVEMGFVETREDEQTLVLFEQKMATPGSGR